MQLQHLCEIFALHLGCTLSQACRLVTITGPLTSKLKLSLIKGKATITLADDSLYHICKGQERGKIYGNNIQKQTQLTFDFSTSLKGYTGVTNKAAQELCVL